MDLCPIQFILLVLNSLQNLTQVKQVEYNTWFTKYNYCQAYISRQSNHNIVDISNNTLKHCKERGWCPQPQATEARKTGYILYFEEGRMHISVQFSTLLSENKIQQQHFKIITAT